VISASSGSANQFRAEPPAHHDRQQGILERIAFEDIGETRADYGAETELRNRPRRMLTQLPQPKLSPASRICAPAARRVENKIRLLAAIGVVAPVAKQILIQTLFRDVFRKRAE